MGDEKYLNKYPDDAAEMARLVRLADFDTATRLLQLWGSSQRDIGSIAHIDRMREKTNVH